MAKILVYNNDTGEEHRLYYPEKSGTIALVEDVESLIESYLSTHYENGDEGSY